MSGQSLTLVDLARRTDPDGDAADVAEILSQANEIYDDLVWKEGNTNTGHVFTVRTGIPQGTLRQLNQGIGSSKSVTAQGRVNCALLEAQSTIDIELLEMAEDQNRVRYEEDNAFLEGMSQQAANLFFYGNAATNPAAFTGLSPYYNTVSTSNAANAANVFNGGGSAANNASIWTIGWNPRTIFGVFPKGSSAGLKVEPLDYTQVAYDPSNNPYRARMTWFRQKLGLCVADWRWAQRIANLDVTSAGLGGTNPYDIFAGLSTSMLRMPKMARDVSGITETDARSEQGLVVHPAIYCNRTIRGFMDIQAIRDKNVLIGPNDYAGRPIDSFRKVPIRVMDQLNSTEAALS